MDPVQLAFCNVNAKPPTYQTNGSAGMDLYSTIKTSMEPGERCLIKTGLKIAIPVGYEGQIRPRSGLANKYGITVLNTPGTIDADYRGEIMVLLYNAGGNSFSVNIGDRIAQIVFNKVEKANIMVVTELSETIRGEGGFGHTGI